MNASAWYPHSFADPPQGQDHEHADGDVMSGSDGPHESASARGAMLFQDRYPAVPESVSAVRTALERFARRYRLPPDTIDAVTLAASEAATNVVLHAYRDANAQGEIEVAAALAADELWVIVTDAGSGLRPRSQTVWTSSRRPSADSSYGCALPWTTAPSACGGARQRIAAACQWRAGVAASRRRAS
jgi:anti-sigma regulatory factor (Ser/Thr protein kinase)